MENEYSDFVFNLGLWQTVLFAFIGVWLFCVVDVLRHEFQNNSKVTWLLMVLFLPILGSLFYLFRGRNKRIKK